MASLDVQHAEIVRDSLSGAFVCLLKLLNGVCVTMHPIACSIPTQLSVRVLDRSTVLATHDQLVERSIAQEYDSLELVALDSIGRIPCVSLTKGSSVKSFKFQEKSEELKIWALAWKDAPTLRLDASMLSRIGYTVLTLPSSMIPVNVPQKMRIYSPSLHLALKLLGNSTAHLDKSCADFTFLPPPSINLYYFKDTLGEGTFGSVESIALNKKGKLFACKTLKTMSGEEFEDYWQTVLAESTFAHCPKVRILTTGAAQVVMNLGSSKVLGDISASGACMGMEGATLQLSFLRALTRDLHKMHYRGIAHCDLKASNVLAQSDGTARIIDFGSASNYEGPSSELKCTIDYCAPEVLENQVWVAGDVWSLGTMALDMCKGLRRGSLVQYDEDGFWSNGKKWNWKTEQYLIARAQISTCIKDEDEGIAPFIARLKLPAQISMGQAAFLSMTLQVKPGQRDNLGLCDLLRPIDMLRWPYPIGPLKPLFPLLEPVEDGTLRTMAIQCTSHITLDGQLYTDSSHIPEPLGRLTAVKAGRDQQLQYISVLLRALDKLTPKLLILSLDVLDRVSSASNLLALAKETPPSHFMLENACIIVASMVARSHSFTSDQVLRQWKCIVSSTSGYTVPHLQALVLRVLSTLQFKVVREDNLWELCGHNTKSEQYLKHMLEAYRTWPNGTQNAYDHSQFLLTSFESCAAPSLPTWNPRIRFKSEKNVLGEHWHHPKFESTLVSLGHATPSAATESPTPPSCASLIKYLGDFKHPFLIPYDAQVLAGVSRKDFELCIKTYVNAATAGITQDQRDMDACIVCAKESERNCCHCDSWSLCSDCYHNFSGSCPQCLRTPELAQEWFIRSGSTSKIGFT